MVGLKSIVEKLNSKYKSSFKQNNIMVSIISYRDSECINTIKSLHENAFDPTKIRVVVIQQNNDNDIDCIDSVYVYGDMDIQVIRLKHTEAKGPIWARFLAQKEYSGSEYYLQIDSHMTFVKNWDIHLKDMLSNCPSKKPIISSYPQGIDLKSKKVFDNSIFGPMECIGINESDHMPRLNNNRKKSPPQKKAPCKSNFLAAGFLFARSQLLFEGGIYDPCLPFLFFGEEILLSAKLYTNGWDFFVPNKNIIYTIWDRSYRPSFQELKDKDIVQSLSKQRYLYTMKQISKEMVPDKRLLKNPEFLRMGSKRTLAEFKKVSGLGKYL